MNDQNIAKNKCGPLAREILKLFLKSGNNPENGGTYVFWETLGVGLVVDIQGPPPPNLYEITLY